MYLYNFRSVFSLKELSNQQRYPNQKLPGIKEKHDGQSFSKTSSGVT